jgi:hypothetical protein
VSSIDCSGLGRNGPTSHTFTVRSKFENRKKDWLVRRAARWVNEATQHEGGPEHEKQSGSIVKPEPPVVAGQGSGSQARTATPLGTNWSARTDVWRGMWRSGMSPIGSGARTRPVKGVVVGWATVESPTAGCGAVRDRMTSVLSRFS